MAIWHTSETASQIPIRCVSNRLFCSTYVFRREAAKSHFSTSQGVHGQESKILKSAIFPHDFGLKFFEKFSKILKKKCDFFHWFQAEQNFKMVSRKAKTRFFERSLSTNRDNRARSIPYDQLLDLKMPHSKNHFLTLQKMLECKNHLLDLGQK